MQYYTASIGLSSILVWTRWQCSVLCSTLQCPVKSCSVQQRDVQWSQEWSLIVQRKHFDTLSTAQNTLALFDNSFKEKKEKNLH